jgi:hypothetical protein
MSPRRLLPPRILPAHRMSSRNLCECDGGRKRKRVHPLRPRVLLPRLIASVSDSAVQRWLLLHRCGRFIRVALLLPESVFRNVSASPTLCSLTPRTALFSWFLGSATTPNQWATPPGSFSLAGASAPSACQPGTYQADYSQGSCNPCVSGYFCPNSSTIVPTICTVG